MIGPSEVQPKICFSRTKKEYILRIPFESLFDPAARIDVVSLLEDLNKAQLNSKEPLFNLLSIACFGLAFVFLILGMLVSPYCFIGILCFCLLRFLPLFFSGKERATRHEQLLDEIELHSQKLEQFFDLDVRGPHVDRAEELAIDLYKPEVYREYKAIEARLQAGTNTKIQMKSVEEEIILEHGLHDSRHLKNKRNEPQIREEKDIVPYGMDESKGERERISEADLKGEEQELDRTLEGQNF